MSPLGRRVGRAVREGVLWGAGDRIAVALSGGADSVALLLLLAELAPRAAWTLAGIIHVHHGLRGVDADADAAFCRQVAGRLLLPIDVVTVDVRAAMAASGRSLEATARTLRYAAFETAAARLQATVVVTGHTADDQAETVLLRLLRGAASRGASGIRRRRGRYARPLLDLRRAELRNWLRARAEPWREDTSNLDPAVPRNRLRQALMPVIERDWPGGVRALARFAELAAADELWLSTQAAAAAADLVRIGPGGVELIRSRLAALAVPIARRVVRIALEQAGGTAAFREVELVRRLAATPASGRHADLHGLGVDVAGDVLRLAPQRAASAVEPFEYRLDVPGTIEIAETGAVFRASFTTGPFRPGPASGWDAVAALEASAVRLPLGVRSRRPGDRFRPLGAPGRRRLQDILVDRKVPRIDRAAVPVVVDADGQIVWVAPLAMAERCRVLTPGAGMVILEFKKGTL